MTWDREKNVEWVTEVPGRGWSSPIVWGDQVFLTSAFPDEKLGRLEPKGTFRWMVYSLDIETGEMRWSREAHAGPADPMSQRRRTNGYATPTPTTDGERVYALFGSHGLYAYELDGTPAWTYPIDRRQTFFDYGHAASPVVHEGQVIFTSDTEEESYIASIDAETGRELWRTIRNETTSYATPLVWKNDLRTEVLTSGVRRIRSYDLDGELLWEMDGGMGQNLSPSPFSSHGLAYVTAGYYKYPHRPVYAFKAGASGDISLRSWSEGKENAPRGASEEQVAKMGGDISKDSLKEEERSSEFLAWYQPVAGPEVTSPLVVGDYYYTLLDQGFITCHDAKTGEVVYGKTRIPGYDRFMSSPWYYNGRIFLLSEDGRTFVVKPGPEFEVLHRNELDELTIATPAIAQGRLFIRTESRLYSITKSRE